MEMAIAFIIIIIAFFFIFKKHIEDLIGRIKSIGKDGVALETGQQESNAEIDPQKEAEALMRQFDSALIRETEDLLKTELEKKNLLGTEAVPVLIRYVAALSIAYSFSEVYRIIWGSQISLLDYLNTQSTQPVNALRVFYNSGVARYPLSYSSYSFEQWLAFLKTHLLLRDDNAMISITVRGREFLTYLTSEGLTKNKIG